MKKQALFTILILLFSWQISSSQNNRFRYHTVVDNTKPNYAPSSVTWKQGHLSIVHDSITKKIDFYTNEQTGTTWRYRFSIPLGGSGGAGPIPEFRATESAIEWKYTTDTQWTFLISLDDLKGDKGEKGDKGDKGDMGLQGIQGIQGVKGDKGDAGTPGSTYTAGSGIAINGNVISATGGGSISLPFVTLSQYGATGSSQTFSQLGWTLAQLNSSIYNGTGATLSNTRDWAAARLAILSGKPIVQDIAINIGSAPLYFEKNRTQPIEWDGQWYKITSTGGAYVIGRDDPTSLNEAYSMQNIPFRMRRMRIDAPTTTKGIQPQATYQASIQGAWINGCSDGVHIRFGLQFILDEIMAWGSKTVVFAGAYTNMSWGTGTNSASNAISIKNSRLYAANDAQRQAVNSMYVDSDEWQREMIRQWRMYSPPENNASETVQESVGGTLIARQITKSAQRILRETSVARMTDIAFLVEHSAPVYFENIIVEGFSVFRAIDWMCQGNTVTKNFEAKLCHFETVNGTGDVAIKLNSPGGVAEVSNVISHYASRMIDATSSGVLVVEVKSIGWWVSLNGKVFVNNNCGWVLANLSQNIINPSNLNSSIQSVFSGTVPQPTTGAVTGYNLFKYLY